jgi:hypothetical protein
MPAAHLSGAQTVDPPAFEDDAARVGRGGTGQQVEQRRLACPVRSDDREDGAARHVERNAVDGRKAAEALGEAADLQDRGHIDSPRSGMPSFRLSHGHTPVGTDATMAISATPVEDGLGAGAVEARARGRGDQALAQRRQDAPRRRPGPNGRAELRRRWARGSLSSERAMSKLCAGKRLPVAERVEQRRRATVMPDGAANCRHLRRRMRPRPAHRAAACGSLADGAPVRCATRRRASDRDTGRWRPAAMREGQVVRRAGGRRWRLPARRAHGRAATGRKKPPARPVHRKVIEGDARDLRRGDGQQREIDALDAEAETRATRWQDQRRRPASPSRFRAKDTDPRADRPKWSRVPQPFGAGAEPDVEGMAERQLARDSPSSGSRAWPGIGEVEDEDEDRRIT